MRNIFFHITSRRLNRFVLDLLLQVAAREEYSTTDAVLEERDEGEEDDAGTTKCRINKAQISR